MPCALQAMAAHSIVLRPSGDADACSLTLAFHKPTASDQPALLVVEVANPCILALLRYALTTSGLLSLHLYVHISFFKRHQLQGLTSLCLPVQAVGACFQPDLQVCSMLAGLCMTSCME